MTKDESFRQSRKQETPRPYLPRGASRSLVRLNRFHSGRRKKSANSSFVAVRKECRSVSRVPVPRHLSLFSEWSNICAAKRNGPRNELWETPANLVSEAKCRSHWIAEETKKPSRAPPTGEQWADLWESRGGLEPVSRYDTCIYRSNVYVNLTLFFRSSIRVQVILPSFQIRLGPTSVMTQVRRINYQPWNFGEIFHGNRRKASFNVGFIRA